MKATDSHLYNPVFAPWDSEEWISSHYSTGSDRTLISRDRCHVLLQALQNSIEVAGDVIECGVYKGGTLKMMASMLKSHHSAKTLYAFDTFEGMPETDGTKDDHVKGDFSDTTLESVVEFVDYTNLVAVKGWIPTSFEQFKSKSICFAHVDVDIYRSVFDSCQFIWPRLSVGGIMVFDDYGFASCYGARLAVDEFFLCRNASPIVLPTGQAVVFKSTT